MLPHLVQHSPHFEQTEGVGHVWTNRVLPGYCFFGMCLWESVYTQCCLDRQLLIVNCLLKHNLQIFLGIFFEKCILLLHSCMFSFSIRIICLFRPSIVLACSSPSLGAKVLMTALILLISFVNAWFYPFAFCNLSTICSLNSICFFSYVPFQLLVILSCLVEKIL